MAEECPVDHVSRQKWLEISKANGNTVSPSSSSIPASISASPSRFSLDAGRWESLPSISPAAQPKRPRLFSLSKDREISSIPRAASNLSIPSTHSAERIANSEVDTGHDRESGNWIYPSQEMFFNAMKRKGHEGNPADMQSIVPIHNAVNERAWKEIKQWEQGRGSERCGGPKLVSFAGDSKALTPRARWNSLVGYSAPFDRHDWVVDRCGTKVEYVIDFYKGKSDEGPLSFYLDVRPKLNSWEGIKMRAAKTVGL